MKKITYKFIFENKRESRFTVDLERKETGLTPENLEENEWTNLEFQQCTNCPLKKEENTKCPPALDVQQILNVFHDVLSTERIQTYVETENRRYFKECDAQTALKSIVGLVMASSSCPILKKMKGMAYYHLPFSNLEETIYRSISLYLLKQYFIFQQGEIPDWKLEHFPNYNEQLQIVNDCFFERIKMASKADANLNAIVSFSSQSQLLSLAFDEYLEILKKQILDC